MKFVVAPNAFKGTMTATQAAAAIAAGVREAYAAVDVVQVPVADGGDGTVEALVDANHGEYRMSRVEGPLGDPVDARYGLIDGGRTAVVELATASGLTLISPRRRDPRKTSTYGFGQLLDTARRDGVSTIIAGIGGSATNDGGAGMAQALGIRLVDADGRDLPRGGAALVDLVRVDPSGLDPGWREMKIRVASDVTNPLTGPRGASAVYGPQKGADPATVEELDRALKRLGGVIGVDQVPGAGAAGGTGAGLLAFLGATLEPGAALVVEATGFDARLPGADVVITGEGRVDEQTGFGKAPGEVAKRATLAGIPVLLIAGAKGAGWETLETPLVRVIDFEDLGIARRESLNDPEGVLRRATVVACRRHSWTRRTT